MIAPELVLVSTIFERGFLQVNSKLLVHSATIFMTISIIIPTLNEAENIGVLASFLQQFKNDSIAEIVIVDGGSMDDTIAVGLRAGVKVVQSPKKGRAAQMNYGASLAVGDVLYFIHADTIPPETYAADIIKWLKAGYNIGRYCTKFNSNKQILKLNAFFTRFDLFICYGGDQTLFVNRKLFEALNGFNENLLIMEEYDLVTRARRRAKYKIMPGDALVSARKYHGNSWWKVQRVNYAIVRMYKAGASQELMMKRYDELIRYR